MIVLIGGGLASARAAETLRAEGYEGPLTLVGDELVPPYHRPPLSKTYLSEPADQLIAPEDVYRANGVDVRLARRAVSLDVERRRVVLDQGEHVAFDKLLVATGAAPRRMPIPGGDLANVVTFRTIEDADALRARLCAGPRVVIVGGGLLGLELAASLRTLGHAVTLLEAAPWPLGRLVRGAEVGERIIALHRDHGVDLRTGAAVRAFLGAERVEAVELGDGTRVACDLVIVSVGVRPATDWLDGSGIRVEDGVLVDAGMRTSARDVFAAGDVARAYHPLYGEHVRVEQYGHSAAQGAVAARNMLGRDEVVRAVPSAGSEQFGRRIQVVGRVQGNEQAVLFGDPTALRFSVAFLDGSRLRAVFAMNRPRDAAAARRLIESASPVDRDAIVRTQELT
ncbi:NAD(P)/FAD-dependent oxidoreductase [Sorangium sp. So ce341]|uniref:NAD(P)/FAD-dependent oxidoreductase n=1 Tax=Sorangium sp. So ce341 TaxID=3133302 RepID=UPI003F5E2117